MDAQQTKEYLKQVFELEGALYKHDKLVDGYKSHRSSHTPPEPSIVMPEQAALPPKNIPSEPDEGLGMIMIGACSWIMLCIASVLMLIEQIGVALLLGAIGGVGAFVSETQKKIKKKSIKLK